MAFAIAPNLNCSKLQYRKPNYGVNYSAEICRMFLQPEWTRTPASHARSDFQRTASHIEARYHHSKAPGSPIAILLHPHPAFGGTMNNPIVHALYQMYQSRGFSVLRFDFQASAAARASSRMVRANWRTRHRHWTGFSPSTARRGYAGLREFPSVLGSQCNC